MFYSAENINYLNEMESEDHTTQYIQNGHQLLDAGGSYPSSTADLNTAYTAEIFELKDGLSSAQLELAKTAR